MLGFKRMTSLVVIICLVISAVLLMGGCGKKGQQEQAKKEEPKKEQIKGGTLGTASVGGTYYVWGGAWAKIVSNKVNFPVSVEVTGGPVHNIQLVSKGELTFGLVSMPTAFDGWNGFDWAGGEKFQNIRVLLPMYPSFMHWWALADRGIKNIRDLNGKIVNLGPKGGTPDTFGRRVLDILEIKPAKIVNSGFNDLVGQMLDGTIDAGLNTGGIPHDAVLQTEASKPIVVFTGAENPNDAKKILEKLPCFFEGKIPKGSYKAVTQDIPVLQFWNVLVCRDDLPDDLAYNITKAYFENLAEFKDVYRPTMHTVPADITRSVIPIHKGALKYYREKGVNIPDNLIPPEAK